MKLLIDGYNLLYAANITGRPGPGTSLFRSRLALLRQLSQRLDESERQTTTIVFDAQNAPPGLPRQTRFDSIEVLFAERRREADDLVIDLINASSHARSLTVVSSDHRIQRAAQRKGARTVDSRTWWDDRQRSRRDESQPTAKPFATLDASDLAVWLDEFAGTIDQLEQAYDRETEASPDAADLRPTRIENPFPPGYADDLLDELGSDSDE